MIQVPTIGWPAIGTMPVGVLSWALAPPPSAMRPINRVMTSANAVEMRRMNRPL